MNNAAIYHGMMRSTLIEVSCDYFVKFMDVNLYGALRCVRASVPHMQLRAGARSFNQASIAVYTGIAGFYCLSKAGIVGLTMNLARELGPDNIKVNAIAPGAIATDATMSNMTENALQLYAKNQALDQIGMPDDLLDAVVFLASSDSD